MNPIERFFAARALRTLSAALLTATALGACAAPGAPPVPAAPAAPSTTALPGGDRDAHGCLPSGGYQWCARTARCERPWELAKQLGMAAEGVSAYCAAPR